MPLERRAIQLRDDLRDKVTEILVEKNRDGRQSPIDVHSIHRKKIMTKTANQHFGPKTAAEIIEIVESIRAMPMKESSHGYDDYKGMTIGLAAKAQMEKTLAQNDDVNPAIALMGVVLAANRAYEKQVKPHIAKLKKKYPALTLTSLAEKLEQQDYIQFKEMWGHADEKKHATLKRLVESYLTLYPSDNHENQDSVEGDRVRLRKWAKQSDLLSRKSDPIGTITNVGIATYQHLRMTFGVDTVKPDQRVMEVLASKFGERRKGEKAIRAVEEIAKITGRRVIEIDQIFVKFGSGYYTRKDRPSRIASEKLAERACEDRQ